MSLQIHLEGGRATTATQYAAEKPARILFVFAHGAGAGQKHPFMVNTAKGLAARGIDVVTFDFPYMHAKRGAPDKAPVLESCFRSVIAAAQAEKGLAKHRLFIGGKSMGGRMATHLGAQVAPTNAEPRIANPEAPFALSGIVVLGYPLHPPGAPEKLRVAHLPSIAVPLLIVQGEKDAFGAPAEFTPHLKTMRAPVDLHAIAGADHSLTVRSKKGAEVSQEVVTYVSEWMRETAQ